METHTTATIAGLRARDAETKMRSQIMAGESMSVEDVNMLISFAGGGGVNEYLRETRCSKHKCKRYD